MASGFDDKRLQEIEATQKELQQSIDQSRKLAEKSQQLLDKHRSELEQDQSRH